jgi:L,D-peptidoglycan transpeptidase YkuD (ErfK/YbiS/YcfS/YnhG family)
MRLYVLRVLLCMLVAITTARSEQPDFLAAPPWASSALSGKSRQVVVVQARQGVGASVSLWDKAGSAWRRTGGPWPAVIGKNGMALADQKKEGDGKTPSGLYAISLAFGESVQADTGLPYRRASEQDIWVDDPQSPLYNQWAQLPTTARSFERMKRQDSLYKLGLVVDYNFSPIVPGAGSAIFIHVWRAPTKGTTGCIALAEDHVRALARALKREFVPTVLLLP